MVEKVIVSLPRPRWEVASHVRSTLLLSSVQSLRKQGFFDRYAAASDLPCSRRWHAYRGTFIVALELFCTKVYVSEHRGSLPRRGEVTFRVSWV